MELLGIWRLNHEIHLPKEELGLRDEHTRPRKNQGLANSKRENVPIEMKCSKELWHGLIILKP